MNAPAQRRLVGRLRPDTSRTGRVLRERHARPGEKALLAYYQGRITFDDLYPDPEDGSLGDEQPTRVPPAAQGVDQSRIQANQIRVFVDALPGIRRELRAATESSGAVYQAFFGEVSPVALARLTLDEVAKGVRSVTAAAFHLTELLALLRAVAAQAPEGVEHYAEICRDAQRTIKAQLDELDQKHPELGTASTLARYARHLQEAHS